MNVTVHMVKKSLLRVKGNIADVPPGRFDFFRREKFENAAKTNPYLRPFSSDSCQSDHPAVVCNYGHQDAAAKNPFAAARGQKPDPASFRSFRLRYTATP
ncbi:MAG: hypothetical protein K9J81_11575 [Desulfohalobiaceae bacterium]|nr:hypothetical protein [Desulfohalobiaceae bacterium]